MVRSSSSDVLLRQVSNTHPYFSTNVRAKSRAPARQQRRHDASLIRPLDLRMHPIAHRLTIGQQDICHKLILEG